jgi:hypothetical protein
MQFWAELLPPRLSQVGRLMRFAADFDIVCRCVSQKRSCTIAEMPSIANLKVCQSREAVPKLYCQQRSIVVLTAKDNNDRPLSRITPNHTERSTVQVN